MVARLNLNLSPQPRLAEWDYSSFRHAYDSEYNSSAVYLVNKITFHESTFKYNNIHPFHIRTGAIYFPASSVSTLDKK